MSVYVLIRDTKDIQNKTHSWKFYILILICLLFLIPISLICLKLIIRKDEKIIPQKLQTMINNNPFIIIGENSDNFDFFLFTSLLPISSCVKYKEESPQKQCNFAPDKEAWSIHGIWPSLRGTMGPSYCKREHFNPDELQSIRNELEIHWSSIESGHDETFWEHEWLKHGSCAEQVSNFDTEFKYFSQGLAWNKQYNVNNMLEMAQIVPNNSQTYKIEEFQAAVEKSIGSRPVVYCVLDKVKNLYLINEIRLCFDKDLELVSCDSLQKENDCPVDDIIYPDSNYISPYY